MHIISLGLETAYDRVPRDFLWWAMRKRSIPEWYVKVIQEWRVSKGCRWTNKSRLVTIEGVIMIRRYP